MAKPPIEDETGVYQPVESLSLAFILYTVAGKRKQVRPRKRRIECCRNVANDLLRAKTTTTARGTSREIDKSYICRKICFLPVFYLNNLRSLVSCVVRQKILTSLQRFRQVSAIIVQYVFVILSATCLCA